MSSFTTGHYIEKTFNTMMLIRVLVLNNRECTSFMMQNHIKTLQFFSKSTKKFYIFVPKK